MNAGWIDELEADLGQAARLRLIANAGGQRRSIPKLPRAGNSRLAGEVGADVARWMADRFGGTEVDIPSRVGQERQNATARLAADILEAGLDEPTRTVNELAAAHGVSRRWVLQLRRDLRSERERPLPLFDGLSASGEGMHGTLKPR